VASGPPGECRGRKPSLWIEIAFTYYEGMQLVETLELVHQYECERHTHQEDDQKVTTGFSTSKTLKNLMKT
jgi:hypothetical protein